MRVGLIARRYLSTWFACDASVVTADLLMYVLNKSVAAQAVGAARVGKSLRIIRIMRFLRMLRLVRIFKLIQVLEELCDVLFAQTAMAFFNVAKLMIGVAVFAHFIACLWYWVGNEADGWVAVLILEDESAPSAFYRYICAYHWTMAQFTPAPVDLHPTNLTERLFCVLVLFVGFVLFSSLLGSTSALISQSRQKAYVKLKEQEAVRKFFMDNHISLSLSARITKFLKGTGPGKKRLKDSELPMLASLPLSLLIELHYEVYSQSLLSHPLFEVMIDISCEVMADICHSALEDVSLNKGEEVFHFGTLSSSMFVVTSGTLDYYTGPTLLVDTDDIGKSVVGEGVCLSEATLWTMWEHQGLLSSVCQSDIIKVVGDLFRLNVQKTLAFRYLKEYAPVFVRRAVEAGEVDDTFVAFSSKNELLNNVHVFRQSSNAVCAEGSRPDPPGMKSPNDSFAI